MNFYTIFARLQKHKHSNEMEVEGNGMATNIHTNIMPNMVEASIYTDVENNDSIRQQVNRAKDT